jgi:hypothetical protein
VGADVVEDAAAPELPSDSSDVERHAPFVDRIGDADRCGLVSHVGPLLPL